MTLISPILTDESPVRQCFISTIIVISGESSPRERSSKRARVFHQPAVSMTWNPGNGKAIRPRPGVIHLRQSNVIGSDDHVGRQMRFLMCPQNTFSVTVLDVPPPGAGLVTEIPICPELAMSL